MIGSAPPTLAPFLVSSTLPITFDAAAPSIILPKGGGALQGMGEKFAANPVNGTGATSIPLGTSPGRSGFGPHLRGLR